MRKTGIIILFVLAGIVVLLSQSNSGRTEIKLRYADSLVGSNTPGISFREFYGNVHLEHGDVDVKSDFAKQYLESNRADLVGNVIITQQTMILRSPMIIYYGNTNSANAFDGVTIKDDKAYLKADGGVYNTKSYIAEFTGNVFVEDDSAKIYSHYIKYNRKSRESFSHGDVWILGKNTNAVLNSDTLLNTPDDNYSLAYGNPVLYQVDSVYTPADTSLYLPDSLVIKDAYYTYDTLTVSCDTMHSHRALYNEKYVFVSNVEIVRGQVVAKADEAVFMKDDDYIILKGSPIVWHDSTQLYADSIIIRIPNNELKTIEAYGNSIAVSRNDTISLNRLDQIMGDRIYIHIDSGKVHGITSIGEAKSLYFFRDEEGENGVDRRTTDTIHVEFTDGDIENIIWLGMTYAEFFPETFVYGKEKSYYLPLFKWTDDKPKKKLLQLPGKISNK